MYLESMLKKSKHEEGESQRRSQLFDFREPLSARVSPKRSLFQAVEQTSLRHSFSSINQLRSREKEAHAKYMASGHKPRDKGSRVPEIKFGVHDLTHQHPQPVSDFIKKNVRACSPRQLLNKQRKFFQRYAADQHQPETPFQTSFEKNFFKDEDDSESESSEHKKPKKQGKEN